jgi:hypothetical protein
VEIRGCIQWFPLLWNGRGSVGFVCTGFNTLTTMPPRPRRPRDRASKDAQHYTTEVEVHLREGFAGEELRLWCDDHLVATLHPRSRVQTGLADVVRVAVRSGAVMRVAVAGHAREARLVITEAPYGIAADLTPDGPVLAPMTAPPRYA